MCSTLYIIIYRIILLLQLKKKYEKEEWTMPIYDKHNKSNIIESQVRGMYGANPIHNEHIDEFR